MQLADSRLPDRDISNDYVRLATLELLCRRLEGLEERFCLVSLDVDFYQVTLDGLRYFWPRMEAGGYIMLHDWGSPKLPGVSGALADYEAEIRRQIPAVPLCDVGGTLVLCK